MKIIDKLNEVPYGVLLLFVMWCLVSFLCLLIYFIPTEASGNAIQDEIPKILTEIWKYVTGATVSALAAVGGFGRRRGHTFDNITQSDTNATTKK